MDPKLFPKMSELEEVHWWFVGRRAIMDAAIKSLSLPKDATILEAGCGTGGNLSMLAKYGQVSGIEYDEIARDLSVSRRIGTILPGHLPEGIPFDNQQFDLIGLFDVLEHLDKDVASLEALSHHLKPNGWLMLTVPANPWMWTHHDDIHHHKRRYTPHHLRNVVKNAGYEVSYLSYFNFFLFPLIAAVRVFQNLTGHHPENGNLQLPSRRINQILTSIFALENRFISNRILLPFGVSLILLARPLVR